MSFVRNFNPITTEEAAEAKYLVPSRSSRLSRPPLSLNQLRQPFPCRLGLKVFVKQTCCWLPYFASDQAKVNDASNLWVTKSDLIKLFNSICLYLWIPKIAAIAPTNWLLWVGEVTKFGKVDVQTELRSEGLASIPNFLRRRIIGRLKVMCLNSNGMDGNIFCQVSFPKASKTYRGNVCWRKGHTR